MTFISTSRPISRLPYISSFIEEDGEVVVGWGRKPSGKRAEKIAASKGIPFRLLEDGFVRSFERQDAPMSLIVDDRGIYYDATTPSQLDEYVRDELSPHQMARASALIFNWNLARISKYNSARDFSGNLPENYILVCDQIRDDASVGYGLATSASFEEMLAAAFAENPGANIVLKAHPDSFSRHGCGYFSNLTNEQSDRLMIISENCHPANLIENACSVYTVTSQMGFEALLWGKPVRTFGMPFYAGRGLTDDNLPPPRWRCKTSLEQLVYSALIRYARYVDPQTGLRCEVEHVISHLTLQRNMGQRFPRVVFAVGFSFWKRRILKRFLRGSTIHFANKRTKILPDATVVVWGKKTFRNISENANILRVEDGFLRSVGLGALLVNPVSWVFDDIGIYYDSTGPSRLERILADHDISDDLIERAKNLRQKIVHERVSKYNLDCSSHLGSLVLAAEKKIILVPGQVTDDESVKFGSPAIKSNSLLLKQVRQSNTDAYVIYRPHPDVVAGLREGDNLDETERYCDLYLKEGNISQLLDLVDEVHTMTSLTGFEALLRGKKVVCYGQPFYAGWGLTHDIEAISSRQRKVSLDELVAACLINYPTYVSQNTNSYISPDQAIDELVTRRNKNSTFASLEQQLRRALLSLLRKGQRRYLAWFD